MAIAPYLKQRAENGNEQLFMTATRNSLASGPRGLRVLGQLAGLDLQVEGRQELGVKALIHNA